MNTEMPVFPVYARKRVGGYPNFNVAIHPFDNHYDLRFHEHTLLEMEGIARAFATLGVPGTELLVKNTIDFESYRISFEKNRDGEFKTTEGAKKRDKRPIGLFPHEWALLEMHGAYGMRNPSVFVLCPCGCLRPIHKGSEKGILSGHPKELSLPPDGGYEVDFEHLRQLHLSAISKFVVEYIEDED